jgi:hypothetical protein
MKEVKDKEDIELATPKSTESKFEKAHGHDEASECALVQDTRTV